LYTLPHLYPPPPRGRGRIKEGEGRNVFIFPSPLSLPPSQREGGREKRNLYFKRKGRD